MPLTPAQIDRIKSRLKAKGLSEDQINVGIEKVREDFDKQYGQQNTAIPNSQSTPQPQITPRSNQASYQPQTATNLSQTPTQQNISSQPQEQDEVKSFFSSLYQTGRSGLLAAGNVAPVALGIAGGFGGGVVGAAAGGVGALPGSALGTTAGTAAGVAFDNVIEDLLGEQDEQPQDQVKRALTQAGVAGVTDLITGGALKIVGKVGNQAIKILGRSVDDIPLKGLRLNPSQLTKFKQKHGVDAAEFVVKNSLLGDEAIEIGAKKASKLQTVFDSLAMNENITVPASNLKDRFAKEMRMLAGVTDEGQKTKLVPNINKSIAKKLLSEWENITKQIDQLGVDELTPSQLTQYRRMLDDVIPDSQFVKPDVRNLALRVRKIFNDVVQEGVDQRLIGEGEQGSLKKLGQELSKYYDFLELAEKQGNLGRGNKLAGLIKSIMVFGGAGVGASTGGAPGAVVGAGAGLAADAVLEDPAVIKALYQLGMKATDISKIAGSNASKVLQGLQKTIGPVAGELVTPSNATISNQTETTPNTLSDQQEIQDFNTNTFQEPTLSENTPQPKIAKPFGGKSKYEILQMAIGRGLYGPALDAVEAEYDRHMTAYNEAVGGQFNSEEANTLLSLRKQAVEAGLDTTIIDQRLESLGFQSGEGQPMDPTIAKYAPAVTRGLDRIEEISGLGTDSSIFQGGSTLVGKATKNTAVTSRIQTDAEFANQVDRYKRALNQIIGPINQMVGAGVLNKDEADRLIENIPDEYTPPEVAKNWFDDIRYLLGVNTNLETNQTTPEVDSKKKDNSVSRQSDVGGENLLAGIGDFTTDIGKKVKLFLSSGVEDMERVATSDPSTLSDVELLFRSPDTLSKEDQARQLNAGMMFIGSTQAVEGLPNALKRVSLTEGRTLVSVVKALSKLDTSDIAILEEATGAIGKVGNKAPTGADQEVINLASDILDQVGISTDAQKLQTVAKRIEKVLQYLKDIDYVAVDTIEDLFNKMPNLLNR